MNSLLKKRTYIEDNVLEFPNMDKESVLKLRNNVNQIGTELNKILKTIKPFMSSELNPITTQDEMIQPREAARMLGVGVRTLANYRDRGQIQFIQHNERKFVYRKSDILQYMNDRLKKNNEYLE